MTAGPPPSSSEPGLGPHAQSARASRGRRHAETEHRYRSPYQRDRDRIIHCRAFRRLEYKTQVFVNHEGDHFRTRLTHTIEVAQIGRTVARALALNEDLVESLALSHDLGHTPFGHLGEDVLDALLVGHGGFNHNRQSLRIVEKLEERYPAHPGLNLTWEVREGIAKHSGPIDVTRAPEFAEYDPGLEAPLEAQLIDLVDEIAYNHHDIDDGIGSGLLDRNALAAAVPLFGVPLAAARREIPAARDSLFTVVALRGLIDTLVTDLIDTTRRNVAASGAASVAEIRAAGRPLAGLSPEVGRMNRLLKAYLHEHLYRHERIERTMAKAREIVSSLYRRYLDDPRLLPDPWRQPRDGETIERTIADYVAGMTDRYAVVEYERLVGPAGWT